MRAQYRRPALAFWRQESALISSGFRGPSGKAKSLISGLQCGLINAGAPKGKKSGPALIGLGRSPLGANRPGPITRLCGMRAGPLSARISPHQPASVQTAALPPDGWQNDARNPADITSNGVIP